MISIIMPVYNAEHFLEECLESIIDQSIEEWELIAVDDFSTDDSYPILGAYAMMDERISVLKNNKKGIIPALRMAYTASKGEFITRMDADDIMHPEKLEKLSAQCKESNIATGKVEYFHDEGEVGPGFKRYAEWLNELMDTGGHWEQIYKECVIPSPAWMMTRKTLDALDAFIPNDYPEDYDLIFRSYKAGLEVNPVKDVIHFWRDHSSRASRNDSNYKDNWFLDTKLYYFLNVDLDHQRPLVLWGAGTKGKVSARYLLDRDVDFIWVTDNIKKRGVPIYHKKLEHSSMMPEDAQVIITVAGPTEQEQIREQIKGLDQLSAFWFC